jgi:hypothetical protein
VSPGVATRGSDLLSLGSFVVLGLPDGMLGTAWPSMRATFGAPVLGPSLTVLAVLVVAAELILTRLAPIDRKPPRTG